jgi:hypothetical protein
MFLRNVRQFNPDCMALYPTRQNSSTSAYLNEDRCELGLINNKILLSTTLHPSSPKDMNCSCECKHEYK